MGGDTLVVYTTGFNGKTWLDQAGRPATNALHVTEPFRRRDFGHMDLAGIAGSIWLYYHPQSS